MRRLFIAFAILVWAVATGSPTTEATQKKTTATAPTYNLLYRFSKGDVVRTKVVQQVAMETTISGTTQEVRSRSESVKRWEIKSVDAKGNITFTHSVERVNMSQQVEGRNEITYNSETDDTPHALYQGVAETIGKPLATITIAPHGLVVTRKDAAPQFNPGIGELLVPLPGKPIKLGSRWYVPQQIRIKLKDGRVKTIKTRQVYKLRAVKTGVAFIDTRTEVLTPISEPAVKAELVQRIQEGVIRFDVEKGLVLSKEMEMDETVTGFNGANSRMEYTAQFNERLETGKASSRTAAKAGPKVK